MKIIITDLTRFQNPNIVCLAGIDPDTGRCIRPMLENGSRLDYFSFAVVKDHKIVPGSCLSGNFVAMTDARAPHVEDCRSTGTVRIAESATGNAFRSVLEMTACTTIRESFGAKPVNRLFPISQPPAISIATLKLDSPATQFRLRKVCVMPRQVW